MQNLSVQHFGQVRTRPWPRRREYHPSWRGYARPYYELPYEPPYKQRIRFQKNYWMKVGKDAARRGDININHQAWNKIWFLQFQVPKWDTELIQELRDATEEVHKASYKEEEERITGRLERRPLRLRTVVSRWPSIIRPIGRPVRQYW